MLPQTLDGLRFRFRFNQVALETGHALKRVLLRLLFRQTTFCLRETFQRARYLNEFTTRMALGAYFRQDH